MYFFFYFFSCWENTSRGCSVFAYKWKMYCCVRSPSLTTTSVPQSSSLGFPRSKCSPRLPSSTSALLTRLPRVQLCWPARSRRPLACCPWRGRRWSLASDGLLASSSLSVLQERASSSRVRTTARRRPRLLQESVWDSSWISGLRPAVSVDGLLPERLRAWRRRLTTACRIYPQYLAALTTVLRWSPTSTA